MLLHLSFRLVFRTCMSRESDHKDSDDVSSSAIDLDIAQVALSLLPSFLYAIVIAGVVSLLFALTLKWSAAFVFWGFVCLVFLVLVGLMITVVVIGLNSESQKDKAVNNLNHLITRSFLINDITFTAGYFRSGWYHQHRDAYIHRLCVLLPS